MEKIRLVPTINRVLKLSLVVCFLAIASGCAPVYIPNSVNVPLLAEKGQANVSASTGISTFDFQTAYAFSNTMGGMFNLSYAGQDKDNLNSHLFVEGGVGFFRKLGKAGRFEVYGGYGWGRAEATTNDDTLHPKSNYHRFFIQPSIGASTDIFDGAFSLRMAYVNFYNTELFPAQSKFLIEPVLTAKMGWKSIRFVCQFGLSIPVSQIVELVDPFEPFIFNLGLQFSLRK